jgi:hypothetical protein
MTSLDFLLSELSSKQLLVDSTRNCYEVVLGTRVRYPGVEKQKIEGQITSRSPQDI